MCCWDCGYWEGSVKSDEETELETKGEVGAARPAGEESKLGVGGEDGEEGRGRTRMDDPWGDS